MPDDQRFLLGYGERLTTPVHGPSGNEPPGPAYSFEQALERLGPEAMDLTARLDGLPPVACPDNEAVATLTLHPQSLAKSYHPKKLLHAYNLRQVGSRPVEVLPERWTKKDPPTESPSTELYVAGNRESFAQWAADFTESPLRIPEAIQRLEAIHAPQVEDRLRNLDKAGRSDQGLLVELILHATATDDYILDAFARFSEQLGVSASFQRRLHAGGLCFIPAEASPEQLGELSQFAFLRTARPLSRIRSLDHVERSIIAPNAATCPLPEKGSVSTDIRVAVFDGGVPPDSQLSPWVRTIDLPGTGPAAPDYLDHGHSVSSALLFGSLTPGTGPGKPLAAIDHYRVLDCDSMDDPFELYDVLRRMDSVLSENQYDFINISIGPFVAVEDDDVHPWTAVLDSHLADGQTLAAIAIGNNGKSNPDPAERRIQVPADCVNGFALGAADSIRTGWARSPYSALGPGRTPGLVKPDALDFGGSHTEPFIVYDPNSPEHVAFTQGTSFATPGALRRAIAIRAHFGEKLSPLAVKALLIHASIDGGHPKDEVGWGRIPPSLDDVMVCDDGEVRIVYQGELTPAQYLRAQIPLPPDTLAGNVTISATFTYATETDPQDPGNYTRSGLGITFRPHADKFDSPEAVDPKPRPFFRRSAFDTEKVLRRDAQQWETVLNRTETMRGSSLHNPVFDVHYNARSNGGEARSPLRIRYALVLTVSSPRTADLYDRVVRAYAGRLEALQPVVDLPIQI